jgi:endonuclease/exonuclease/phosphatase family metal-dependent hydrolase
MRTPLLISVMVLVLLTQAHAAHPGSCNTTIQSFNIRYGTASDGDNAWQNRRFQVRLAIRHTDPDLIGLQECLDFQADDLDEAFREYELVGVGRDDGERAGEMCAVMVRRSRFEILNQGHVWLSESPTEPGVRGWDAACPRMLTWVLLHDRYCDPDTFIFANTHFDHVGETARRESARLVLHTLRDVANGRPVILTGDFNATAGESEPWDVLVYGGEKAGLKLIDTWQAADRREDLEDDGTFHGFDGKPDTGRIDWILVTDDWRIEWAWIDRKQVGGRWPSDHFPVGTRLRSSWQPGVEAVDGWTGATR